MVIINFLRSEIETRAWYAPVILATSILYLFLCLYTVSDRHLTVALKNIARFLRLPADLAGMTLLAFGNGAPDFFTAIFGASQAPEMILSGAVGAALFTFTIVYGLVIFLQQPDIVIVNEEPVAVPARLNHLPFFRNLLLCLFCLSSLLFLLSIGVIKFWMPLTLLCVYLFNLSISIITHIISESTSKAPLPENSTKKAGENLADREHLFWSLNLFEKACFVARNLANRSSVSRPWSVPMSIIRFPMTLVTNVTLLPVYYPDESNTCADANLALQLLNRMRLLVAPFGTMTLLGFLLGISNPLIWLLLFGLAATCATGLWLTSNWNGPPRFLLAQSIITFITCLAFIYLISNELITCLKTFGELMGISLSTMGILVLAWGNSFGDLVADTRMSRSGFLNMAVFGVFAAHIQNVLFTLGTAFLLATLSNGGAIEVGVIDVKVFIGMCIVLTVLLSSLLLIPKIFNFRLPKPYGVCLLSLYGLFACAAILLELFVKR